MHSDLVLPTADTHCDKFSKREYLSIPILYIDVNLEEGRKERIVIYEGDRAEELAEEFGKKHHLGEDTVAKLKTVLEVQISSILEKIDEENE